MLLGFQLYDTDREAKRLILSDASVRQAIIALLGSEAYADGVYQTAYVASRVFADAALLQALNAIVHPAVIRDIQLRTQQGDWVIESALLFSSGIAELCDKTILVTAPEEVRIQRVVQRDKTDAEQVRTRIHAQEAEQDWAAQADIIVLNDGTSTQDQLCRYIVHNL